MVQLTEVISVAAKMVLSLMCSKLNCRLFNE
jgi:hypothetical protein